jgi:ribonucleoside-diphosphate reductase alpha chain
MTMSRGGRVVVDYPRLVQCIRTAVHFLDNVIDINRYPLSQISAVTRGNRKIGLGVMGWADLLIQLGIPYGSEQALMLADKIMGFIQRLGHRASADLARIRGPYPNFSEKTAGRDRDHRRRRNATVTTIAPAGTLSIIAGCSSGIEPLFALSFSRKQILDGEELQEMHPGLLEDLNSRGAGKTEIVESIRKSGTLRGIPEIPEEMRERYATAMEISPEWHVRMQAAFQSHSDNAVSKTVNLPYAATPVDVELVYRLAHKLDCKGITVYRDRCRETQVLNIGCVACA